jgi:hypothetical protein
MYENIHSLLPQFSFPKKKNCSLKKEMHSWGGEKN